MFIISSLNYITLHMIFEYKWSFFERYILLILWVNFSVFPALILFIQNKTTIKQKNHGMLLLIHLNPKLRKRYLPQDHSYLSNNKYKTINLLYSSTANAASTPTALHASSTTSNNLKKISTQNVNKPKKKKKPLKTTSSSK